MDAKGKRISEFEALFKAALEEIAMLKKRIAVLGSMKKKDCCMFPQRIRLTWTPFEIPKYYWRSARAKFFELLF